MSDVSGTWLGTYWQQGEPTRFEATFIQGGNTLSGNILDDRALGEATISGEVVGRVIQFSKRYLTSSPTPIHYIGQVAEDEQTMRGTWQITGYDSGHWEARRTGDNLIAELQSLEQRSLAFTQS